MPRTIHADGRTIVVPDDATPEEINQIVGPAPKSEQTVAPQQGFVKSLLSSVGITPLAQLPSAGQSLKDAAITAATGPIVPLAKSLYEGGKRSAGELKQGLDAIRSGNTAAAVQHAITSLPVLGPVLDKASDQYADTNYLGEAGTLVGGAAQMAPALLSGVDAILPSRPTFGAIPNRTRATAMFDSLNADLENQPVPLKQAIQPLQRVTELGTRGGTLPKPVNDLLTRSQGLEPMSYPEARDYQSNLSDLSRDDQGALNGKMRNAIAKLNQGLYGDVYDAADQLGRGPDFAQAMKEYRQAAQLKDFLTKTREVGVKAAVPAMAGAGGYTLYQHIKELSK